DLAALYKQLSSSKEHEGTAEMVRDLGTQTTRMEELGNKQVHDGRVGTSPVAPGSAAAAKALIDPLVSEWNHDRQMTDIVNGRLRGAVDARVRETPQGKTAAGNIASLT